MRAMNANDRALIALATTQRQVFTRQQALDAGLSHHALQRRVATGGWVAWGPHTLHVAGAELDYRGRLLAGLLDLGPAAAVSARAAACRHGFDGFGEGPLEFLVPRRHRNRAGRGTVSSALELDPIDVAEVDGLRVTSGTRTVIQLLGRVDERELGNAVDSCIRSGLTSPRYLRERLTRLGRRGRVGVALFDRVMESAGVQSWLERQFVTLIRQTGLPAPAAQRVYRRDKIHVARVDFDFAPLPVVVEVGGRRGYLSAEERRRQDHRRNELQLLGKVVYFFTTEDVVDSAPYVVAMLRSALAMAAAA
jgi:hypothetical protein